MSNEWKSTVWLEKLKHKPERYWIRDEIEEIIKEENIDRSKFHEVSKYSYEKILRKFYYTFFEYDRNVRYTEPEKINLSYAWLYFRKDLNKSDTVYWDNEYSEEIKNLVPEYSDGKSCFMILSESWVYEGEISEILKVLSETDSLLEDFYIVSKKFDWVIVYCEDGDCALRVDSGK